MTATDRLIDRLPDDIEQHVRALLARACNDQLTLATAESCTGGLVGALLTDVEGMSHAYERGFIVYTDEAKAALLGIPHSLIDMHGAVSREVALAMVEGALFHSRADVALAVTGFAGAGAAGDEPGLVHLACQRRGGSPDHREAHFGDIGRAAIRLQTVRTAVDMMRAALERVASAAVTGA
ncbi:MAG: damage-inducible protein CinA [Sphingobium sp. 66-54]|nr:MAG: damage-inducible protein CinA [Sphingobium sp. 66-54]